MVTHITYAHKAMPDGQRFRQRFNVPLPSWAVNIRYEVSQPNKIIPRYDVRRWEVLVICSI